MGRVLAFAIDTIQHGFFARSRGQGGLSCVGNNARGICITGPTSCGKTDLALSLANEFDVEIVSMDSAMVYRGMDIGTAKPSQTIRKEVPHHLVDILEPTEVYSAGRFASEARKIIDEIAERGKLPLVVGGTLLYLRALRNGLASLPGADSAIRASLDKEAMERGWPALHQRLKEIDPKAAARIAPMDRQRIQRALEVYEITGTPLSKQLKDRTGQGLPADDLDLTTFILMPADRGELGRRIETRFDGMVEAGLISEVARLRSRGDLTAVTPAVRAVGYRQVWAYLHNEYAWEEAHRRAITATRQLAKRQMTWLRAETDAERLAIDVKKTASKELMSRVRGACVKLAT